MTTVDQPLFRHFVDRFSTRRYTSLISSWTDTDADVPILYPTILRSRKAADHGKKDDYGP